MSSRTAKALSQGNSVLKKQKIQKQKTKKTNKTPFQMTKAKHTDLEDLRRGTQEGELHLCVTHAVYSDDKQIINT